MKNIYLSILLLYGIISQAQVVFENSLSDAFKKAKQQDKPVFIEYFNKDCSVCQRLGTLLRQDAAVGAHYNSNFINYAMDTYDELSAEDQAFMTAANLHFESVPVLLYFDKNKNFLHYSSGSVSSETLLTEAKKALLSESNTAGLKAKYDLGDRSVRTLYAYANALIIYKNDVLLKKVGQELYASFNPSELPTKKSYLILKNVITTSENGFFQYWMNNLALLKDFETGIHSGSEQSYLERILLRELSDPNIKNWDDAKKNRYKAYILKLKLTENPGVFFGEV